MIIQLGFMWYIGLGVGHNRETKTTWICLPFLSINLFRLANQKRKVTLRYENNING